MRRDRGHLAPKIVANEAVIFRKTPAKMRLPILFAKEPWLQKESTHKNGPSIRKSSVDLDTRYPFSCRPMRWLNIAEQKPEAMATPPWAPVTWWAFVAGACRTSSPFGAIARRRFKLGARLNPRELRGASSPEVTASFECKLIYCHDVSVGEQLLLRFPCATSQ